MKLFTTREIARILGYNDDSYIRRLIIGGKIKAQKIGGQWMIGEESVHEFKTRNNIKSNFKELLSLNYRLRSVIEKDLDKYRDASTIKNFVSSFSLGRSYKTHGALLLLCEEGFGEDATMLVRSLFETMITLLYIQKDKTDETAERYRNYDWILRKKMFDYASTKPYLVSMMKEKEKTVEGDGKSKSILKKAAEIQDKYKYSNGRWSKDSIELMAQKVGRYDEYKTMYTIYCQFSHSLPRIVNDYVVQNGDGYTVNVARGENWIKENLMASFDFIFTIFRAHLDQYGESIPEDLQKVYNDYEKLVPTL